MKAINHPSRRFLLRSACGFGTAAVLARLHQPAMAQESDPYAYPGEAAAYLKRILDPEKQRFALRENYPGGFSRWQQEARAELRRNLGLDKIAADAGKHQPVVDLSGPVTDMGGYTRQMGTIETELDVRMPFYLLKPKAGGPWPLAVFPHGHSDRGHHTTAGVFDNEAQKKRALAEDRDVAVQAVQRGMLAIAPTVRGLAGGIVPDIKGRHGKRDCRSHVMHCLLAGRTAVGERVWDISRILDWATKLPNVDSKRVLSMGNSGGGMVTIFAAAYDQRISVAVPSCSFAPTTSKSGYIFHCDCNTVPGLQDLGGLPGVAGLAAPRFLLSVNGVKDSLHSPTEIEAAAAYVRSIYRAAGQPKRYEHRWGAEGHRFYKDLMWPFIEQAFGS